MWSALSLTRGQVCRLRLLLVLGSAVIPASESHGNRDDILLPQIRDFYFRRLLRLAGLRWRYSIPTTHGSVSVVASRSCRTDRFPVSPLVRVRNLLPSNGRCSQSHYLATGLHPTIYCSMLILAPVLPALLHYFCISRFVTYLYGSVMFKMIPE
jgi:hypothetical protein